MSWFIVSFMWHKSDTKYDFTKSTLRQHTNAEKYTQMQKKFGTSNIIPVPSKKVWVNLL